MSQLTQCDQCSEDFDIDLVVKRAHPIRGNISCALSAAHPTWSDPRDEVVGFVAWILVFFLLLSAIWTFWHVKHRNIPCPTALIPLLDNPFTRNYHKSIVARLDLSPGLTVLDAGCGPGLLTVPIAQIVGPQGRVLALDIQAEMIERAKARVKEAGLDNVDFIVAGLGAGKLATNAFDRALLVTVLGEIPDKPAALREIYSALKPGGTLSVSEVLPDPDYQSASKVKAMAAAAGLRVKQKFGNFLIFTLNLEKP